MRRLFCTIVILLVLSGISCAPAKKEPQQGVVLTLYHWMEKDRKLWEEEIIAPFEASHRGITVKLETSPYGLYVSKSLTSIAAGTALADVMLAEDWFGQELIRTHYARNLMPYVRKDIPPGDFYTDAWREWRGVAQNADELYGFPACLGLTVLFYNKDLFDKARLPYPDTTWSYDDLLHVGQQLTVDRDGDGTPDQWGLTFDVHYTGLETMIYTLGGRILTADSRRAALTEESTLRALHFIRDIFLKERIASNTTSFVNPWESFVGGRSAMILIGSHGAINLEGSSMRWDITYPPKGADGRRMSRRFSMAFMIPRTSAHPDEAWELLDWILTKSPRTRLNEQYLGMMPTYRPFAEAAEWIDAVPQHNRRLLVELERQYAFPLFTPAWQEWRDNNLTPEMMQMIQGTKSVEDCARDAEQRINAVLARVLPD